MVVKALEYQETGKYYPVRAFVFENSPRGGTNYMPRYHGLCHEPNLPTIYRRSAIMTNKAYTTTFKLKLPKTKLAEDARKSERRAKN